VRIFLLQPKDSQENGKDGLLKSYFAFIPHTRLWYREKAIILGYLRQHKYDAPC
jgi:hypothetical protein